MLVLLHLTNDRSYDWLTSVSQQSSNVSQESQAYKYKLILICDYDCHMLNQGIAIIMIS